ncbi:MAG: porin [Burkholderiales bacterium]|nr:porin [Burkholderiales bacterium]
MSLRKFFWLAALGALLQGLAGTARAQVDYSIYGVADFSYGRFQPSGLLPANRFNSNSMTASFVGVNLSDGLDGGWKPGLTLETFVRFQDFKTGRNDRDPLLSRNAFVFLNSRFGNVQLGRLQTLLFNVTTRFNAFGNSVAFSPAVRHLFAAGNLEGVQGDFYWDRALGYQSPKLFENTTLSLMHAQGSSDERGSYNGGTVVFAQGVGAISFSAQHVSVFNGIDTPIAETAWQLGGSYNFGIAQVFGQLSATADGGLGVHSRIATGGVKWAIGPGYVLAQVAATRASGAAVDRRQTTASAGYLYSYDSQTDFYLVGMNDRVSGQTNGVSVAAGVRLQF